MASRVFRVPTLLLVIAFVIVGCGPSAEQMATQTASAWTATPSPTSTPTPTPTPTPIPYGLDLQVSDASGNPIAGSVAVVAELGENPSASQTTDAAGTASWQDLPGESVTISVSAQGYLPSEIENTLERGPNAITASLERDPFGLLPSEACAAGETLLYVEDFQDGYAENWPNVVAATDFAAPNGWSIGPDEEGNLILSASETTAFADDSLMPEGGMAFDNAVWRLRLRYAGTDADMFLNWRQGADAEGDWRYIVQLGDGALLSLQRLQNPEPGHFAVGNTNIQLRQDQWYDIELSTFQGVTELWLDGRRMASYTDPQPLPAGTIGLETHLFQGSDTSYYFDNLVVCGLEAPFASAFSPE